MNNRILTVALATFAIASPALANSLVAPGPRLKIARSTMAANPTSEWNRLSLRGGKFVEVWTIDGDELNKATFYGGVPVGQTMFREADKKNAPLPRVTPNMLITDIPALLESSYRIQLNTTQMSINGLEPEKVGGHKGVRFTYSFVRQDDEVQRKGEAVGAFVDGRLYLVTYEAPAIHFFEKDIEKFRQLARSLKI